jgi:hypothetical protein
MAKKSRSDLMWNVIALGAAALSGFATRKVVGVAWRGAKKSDPPTNPVARNTGWTDALEWVAVSGVALGVARLVAQRGAAAAWKAKTGEYPAPLRDAA